MFTLPCLTLMSSLKTIILKYILVCVFLHPPRLSLLCAPWQKTRPNSKRRPFTSFCFVRFFKWLFCSCVLSQRTRLPRALMPAVRGSAIPPFAAQRFRRSRDLTPPFVAQPSHHSWEFTPPFADQPAHRSQEMTLPSTANPSPPARCWINARRPASDSLPARPASDSMPAGLPLTQARRIAADSSPPDCRWLKLAGLPLTHARWPSLAGKANSPLPQFTPPSAAHRPRCSREITPPSVGKANPPSAAPSGSRGKPTRRPRSLGPPPAVASSSLPAPAVEWSSQPVMVSPSGRGRILTRLWPKVFLTFVSCVFSPGGLLIPLSCPMDFFWGGT